MNNELERRWRKVVVVYYSGFCMERMEKTMRSLTG
jgi:hypothetical protein